MTPIQLTYCTAIKKSLSPVLMLELLFVECAELITGLFPHSNAQVLCC